MDARKIIFDALFDAHYDVSISTRTERVIDALNAAGYTILHCDENHGPTLERAASKADSLNFVHHVGGGRKLEKTQALIEPSRIASAIRAMEVKHG
ncbi:hypothetical protein ACTDI4_17080 [Mesorhizobium sp. PUT5]|uniref:hypothetical protein n=1 Tax=Mesorhizobium sp. PUT5 TaxID=3454629 RepID=UPI003FA40E4C